MVPVSRAVLPLRGLLALLFVALVLAQGLVLFSALPELVAPSAPAPAELVAVRWTLLAAIDTLRTSRGTAIGVTEQEILEGVTELGRREGLFVAPEGAATWMAMRKLLRAGWLSAGERILLLNTGSGGKYLENLEGKYHPQPGEQPGGLHTFECAY